MAVWASGCAAYAGLPIPLAALRWWKDVPDIWVAGAIVLTLWFSLSYWRTSEKVFLFGAIAFQLVAIAFKEMAYIAPLLAGLVLWLEWRKSSGRIERRHAVLVAILLVIVFLSYAYRTWALQGPGFRFGSNGSWFGRWVLYVLGGRPGFLLLVGQGGSVGVALVAIGMAMLYAKRSLVGTSLLASGIVLTFWMDWSNGEVFQTLLKFLAFSSAVPFWELPIVHDFLASIAVIGLYLTFFYWRDVAQIFGFGWSFFAYLPLLTAPITEHALYIPSIGTALLLTVSADRLLDHLKAQPSNQRVYPD